MLLLIAEYNFAKEKFLLQTFSNESPKIDYQWKIAKIYFARRHRIVSVKPITSSLKLHPSRCLVTVHGCNLAPLSDNCNV